MPTRHWHELAYPAFGDLPADTVAVLPVGAIEQHGPHLPVWVDSCINELLLGRAMAAADPALSLLVLPMQAIGKSDEHLAFPGTLSLTAGTLTAMLIEIGRSVARSGVRRLVLLNSHGGQPQIMDIVARTLRIECGLFVVNAAWFAMGQPDGLFDAAECRHGIHGGEIETSLMLHLRPDLVDMSEARDFRSLGADMEAEYRHLTPEGRFGFGWQAQDLNPAGACGNAAAADAGRGRQVAEHCVATFLELVAEVARYPLANLREGPLGPEGAR